VSAGIIEDHGGQIKVKSRIGYGTTFTIFLPVEAPHAAA
jgi:signal transduction histidine kinase